MAGQATLLYIVVVDENGSSSFRYTRSLLHSTLQLMGCKPRHAFEISRRVFDVIRGDPAEMEMLLAMSGGGTSSRTTPPARGSSSSSSTSAAPPCWCPGASSSTSSARPSPSTSTSPPTRGTTSTSPAGFEKERNRSPFSSAEVVVVASLLFILCWGAD